MMESVDAAPCGAYNMHGEHHYRSGFLGFTKTYCPGTPFPGAFDSLDSTSLYAPKNDNGFDWDPVVEVDEYIEQKKKNAHKHTYTVEGEYCFGPKRETDILWHCPCGNYFVMDRNLFWRIGVNYDIVLPADA